MADNYYDPVLSDWFEGPSGQAYAAASVPGLKAFNAFLVATYAGLGAQSADIQAAFQDLRHDPDRVQMGNDPYRPLHDVPIHGHALPSSTD